MEAVENQLTGALTGWSGSIRRGPLTHSKSPVRAVARVSYAVLICAEEALFPLRKGTRGYFNELLMEV